MKKMCFSIIILFQFITFLNGQWLPEVRLTNNNASSHTCVNNTRCIAANQDTVIIVWRDDRDGNYEIYYKCSTNCGETWGTDIRLTNNFANSFSPSVSVIGSNVHVIWEDDRDGNNEMYYKRSTNCGETWGTDTRLTFNSANSFNPSLSVHDTFVHIVWFDERDGNREIYYKHSMDSGENWGPDIRLTNDSAVSLGASVSVSDQYVHIAWEDTRDGNSEIYYKRSTDGGDTWGIDTRLTVNSAFSLSPSISVSGSVVHIAWGDSRDGNFQIYYKRSSNGGLNWGDDTKISNDPTYSESPTLLISDQVVHLVWEGLLGNFHNFYKQSTNNGVNWGPDIRLTNGNGSSFSPSLAVSGQAVHVVWEDDRDGNWEIYYKCNPTGNPIGIINMGPEIPKSLSLSQNYPNPFNPTTKIKFDIPKSVDVKLVVYDVLGREVTTLVNENLKPGIYEIEWNALNMPSGVYFYKINAEDFSQTKKMVLVK